MIMNVKMCPKSQLFGKIDLKAITHGSREGDRVIYEEKRENSIFLCGGSEPSPVLL